MFKDSGVSVVNFEHISHLFLLFLQLNFKQVNVSWGRLYYIMTLYNLLILDRILQDPEELHHTIE